MIHRLKATAVSQQIPSPRSTPAIFRPNVWALLCRSRFYKMQLNFLFVCYLQKIASLNAYSRYKEVYTCTNKSGNLPMDHLCTGVFCNNDQLPRPASDQ